MSSGRPKSSTHRNQGSRADGLGRGSTILRFRGVPVSAYAVARGDGARSRGFFARRGVSTGGGGGGRVGRGGRGDVIAFSKGAEALRAAGPGATKA